MKFIFESEDCLVGILFGIVVVGLSGKWFALPYAKTILMVLIPIYSIFIVLDVFHEFTDLSRHFMFIGAAILHNIFDFAVCIAFYAYFFNFSVPLISMIVPYLSNLTVLHWLGLFEIISHIIWLGIAPFNT